MSGTKEGSKKAAKTRLERYGKAQLIEWAKKGGEAPYEGKKGYAANKKLAIESGKKSKRK